ncbi:hypothetical protein M436DRAFT_66721 [Aureobasidium namibiae CBS 147.97]|uniref:Uncharacterized protein n=1 Tax=Aureobasidium namibiae CBS 147.97 TaxID=1043004 RepID=A0A074WJ36_9PEZI
MNAITSFVTIVVFGTAYLAKRCEQEDEAARRKEEAETARRRDEAEVDLRKEELDHQRLRDEADFKFRKLEAEIALQKFLAELEVSKFVVRREDGHVELNLAGSRDDIEVDVARGTHVFRAGSNRRRAEDTRTIQARHKTCVKYQAHVEDDVSSD